MSSKFKNLISRRKKAPPKIDEPTIDQENLAQSSKDGSQYGLEVLYNGADADHPDVDFVAVHGMDGHPIKSFTDTETGCCWLRDLLPSDFPHCRVFSYGYSADFIAKAPTSLSDQARTLCMALKWLSLEQRTIRRRIFICHSIGGLLVKRVLIEAHQDPQLIDVYRYTAGIVFLGTPHRSSSSADLVVALTKIISVGPGAIWVNADLRQVQIVSERLNEINYRFAHMAAESLMIGSFYETKTTKHMRIVVERSSAILGSQSESCISLDANHAQLCRFRGQDDLNYKQVWMLIARFRRTALLADVALVKYPTSHPASSSQESLAQWFPCVASKKGKTSMGLLEMAGSMEQPKDYLDAEMDIIAVHGLRGSPVRSWTNKSPQTMWLRDMLQVDVSTSRVMSYGYRVDGVFRLNKFDLDRLAKDLVDSIIYARAGILDTAVRITES